MTAAELAEVADAYYDKDGRPIHSSTTTGVNTIGGGGSNAPSTPTLSQNYSPNVNAFTTAFEEDGADINAIRARQSQKQRFNNANRPQSSNNNNNSRYNNSSNRPSNANNNARPNSKNSVINSNGICGYHEKFGNEARTCASGCKRWSFFNSKNAQASKQ